MTKIFTRHAKRRMRQRGVSSARVSTVARRGGRSQGQGVYRVEVERGGKTTVVIYKIVHGKKVILSTWKK